ncbi:hypothetical protein ElP_10170 [Tautonia plasticadhaerens]|uniref:Uncharacterized protein n=1 Tax=Tautonia plasticadhaerens TaxID=2527974 RepID=A0A518GX53_9BACT|nr:hypothetical protein ElP_10170 [Tautonia plasticadhaerens]
MTRTPKVVDDSIRDGAPVVRGFLLPVGKASRWLRHGPSGGDPGGPA